MTHYNSPDEWAAHMESNLLHCRELGHSWSAYTVTYDNTEQCYHRTLMFSSCETERIQVLDSSGEVVRNAYRYVDGYLAKGQMDHVGHKVPRSTFRLAALHRATSVTSIKGRRRGAS